MWSVPVQEGVWSLYLYMDGKVVRLSLVAIKSSCVLDDEVVSSLRAAVFVHTLNLR